MRFMPLVVASMLGTLLHAQDGPVGFASLEGSGDKRVAGGTAREPTIVLVSGTINVDPKGKESRVASDKTILGLGADATISGGGFVLGAGVQNVIIRNLTIGDTKGPIADPTDKELDYDGVQMDGAHHVWIDHCHFRDINAGASVRLCRVKRAWGGASTGSAKRMGHTGRAFR